MKYKVQIEHTVIEEIEVEASSQEEAEELAIEQSPTYWSDFSKDVYYEWNIVDVELGTVKPIDKVA